ncbi:MAG: hypothetical protein KDA75_14875 [Planctomycetaceae bacterium]|nr:hypothetical protein [Planctomycetaceae bacterium]
MKTGSWMLLAVIIGGIAGGIARQRGAPSPRRPYVVAIWTTLALFGIILLMGVLTGEL